MAQAHRVFVVKPEGKRTDGFPRVNGKKLQWNVSRIYVVQERGKWQAIVKTAVNLQVP